jgi:hypothetical protein
VSQLAVRTIDFCPLSAQLQDRLDLPVQQSMHRRAAGTVDELADRPAGLPALHPHAAQPHYQADTCQRPALIHSVVDQIQQRVLSLGVDSDGDWTYKPQPAFARNSRLSTDSS